MAPDEITAILRSYDTFEERSATGMLINVYYDDEDHTFCQNMPDSSVHMYDADTCVFISSTANENWDELYNHRKDAVRGYAIGRRHVKDT